MGAKVGQHGAVASEGSGETGRTPDEIRALVREGYSATAPEPAADEIALRIGYTREQLASLPPGANVGFGCANPIALADLAPGETVVDLGSGAGVDVFLAARAVGPRGRAIGIDMTPKMLEQARAAARLSDLDNTEFHEGAIESLPLEDASVDVVISNGVINYSPERERTFREALRVLRPGGRLVVADLALARPPAPKLARIARSYLGNIGRAEDYPTAIRAAGFRDVKIDRELGYGRLVFAEIQGFRAAASEDGASDQAVEQLLDDLSSLLVRARK